jgi:hypothetical protein
MCHNVRKEHNMSDPMKQAWNDVAEGFSTLGHMMKERYQGPSGEETSEAPGGTQDPGAALRDAFDRLVAAGRDLGDRAADVVRDEDVKAQAKRAAASLNDALSATVDLIGEEVGGLFKRSERPDSTPQVAAGDRREVLAADPAPPGADPAAETGPAEPGG